MVSPMMREKTPARKISAPQNRPGGKSRGGGASRARPLSDNLKALFDHGEARPERLAKRMAAAGLCSRRDAEKWITDGRVMVNGELHTSPAYNAAPEDIITVDGKPLTRPEPPRLWRYYKPRGLVVSHRDEKGRKTMFEDLPADLPRVISVGRLDLDSEGLILLTNSGELARHMELPATGWSRKYRVRVHGRVEAEKLTALEEGITIDGIHYRGVKATIDRQANSNAWLTVVLKEGKNREIRRIMDTLGYPVSRLIRVSFGPFTLNTLEEGSIEEVRRAILRDQLGLHREAEAQDKTGTAKPGKPARRNPTGGRPKNAHHQRQKTRH